MEALFFVLVIAMILISAHCYYLIKKVEDLHEQVIAQAVFISEQIDVVNAAAVQMNNTNVLIQNSLAQAREYFEKE